MKWMSNNSNLKKWLVYVDIANKYLILKSLIFLLILRYFQEVLNSNDLSSDTTEIQLNKDGSWSTHTVEKKTPPPVAKVEKAADDSIEIISDDVGK